MYQNNSSLILIVTAFMRVARLCVIQNYGIGASVSEGILLSRAIIMPENMESKWVLLFGKLRG